MPLAALACPPECCHAGEFLAAGHTGASPSALLSCSPEGTLPPLLVPTWACGGGRAPGWEPLDGSLLISTGACSLDWGDQSWGFVGAPGGPGQPEALTAALHFTPWGPCPFLPRTLSLLPQGQGLGPARLCRPGDPTWSQQVTLKDPQSPGRGRGGGGGTPPRRLCVIIVRYPDVNGNIKVAFKFCFC